jgi:hypothetical protein
MTTPAALPTATQPTGWFLFQKSDGSGPAAAARQYWPESTIVEVWNPATPSWTPRPILEQLSDDTSWADSTEAEVEAFIRSAS